MANVLSLIKPLKTKLQKLSENECKKLMNFHTIINDTVEFQAYIENLWIGGWGRNDYNHYTNPKNVKQALEVNDEYFYNLLEKQYKINISSIGDEIFNLLKPLKSFQQEIITELSIIRDKENFNNEIELLKSIENFDWGLEANDYVKLRTPKNIPIYDMSILSRGILTPPHIIATGFIISLMSKAFVSKSFVELASRLIRQVEIKLSTENSSQHHTFNEEILNNIFDNFHQFYKQLRNRHANRVSIDIVDEYDVQDLLHAVLRLHFKDVREEEYTPSYGGSSTRMDFLLKNETIVIEVKKTREKLSDKEIGEQLILDVAHYKNHPDCKLLKCFVYDPENRVKNPRGLEADINKLTSEEMKVELYIRP